MSQELERVYTIPLGKVLLSPDNRRAKRAINMIKEFARHHMKVEDIRIDEDVAHQIWSRGIKHPPRKIRVRMARTDEGFILVSPYDEDLDSIKDDVKQDAKPKESIPDTKPGQDSAPAADERPETPAQDAGITDDTKPETPAQDAGITDDTKPETPKQDADTKPETPKQDAGITDDTKPETPAPEKPKQDKARTNAKKPEAGAKTDDAKTEPAKPAKGKDE